MKLTATELNGVFLVEPRVFRDDRGWFMESHNAAQFDRALRAEGQPAPVEFVQDNHSCSGQWVLRGLHYQRPPHAQGKLVRVVAGAAFDVAVDIRRDSPNFGRWIAVELSAQNRRQVWIPAGFAHGFLALQPDTQLVYKTTDFYERDSERCIRWDDPAIGVAWPLPAGQAPVLAAKDAQAPTLAQAEVF